MIKAPSIMPGDNGGSSAKKSRFSKLLQAGPSSVIYSKGDIASGSSLRIVRRFLRLKNRPLFAVALSRAGDLIDHRSYLATPKQTVKPQEGDLTAPVYFGQVAFSSICLQTPGFRVSG